MINTIITPSGQYPESIIRNKENEISAATIQTTKFLPQIKSLPETSKLTLNVPYTYKALCEILNQPTKAGKSKEHQLLEFSRFFKYEKIGTKYFVQEIYSEPLSYLPPSSPVTSKQYTKEMTNIILSYLYATGKEVLYLSHKDLIIITGLANHLYTKYYANNEELQTQLSISSNDINDFFSRSYSKMKEIINSALSSMQSRSILMYIPTYIIVQRTNTWQGDSFELREASSSEMGSILSIQHEALQSLSLSSLNELHYKPQYGKLFKIAQTEIMNKKEPYWLNFYKTVKIITKSDIIRSEANTDLIKQSLNIKMVHFLNNQTVKDSLKYLTTHQHDESQDEWIQAQRLLTDTLIKIF